MPSIASAAATCDCVVPMLSTGWGIAVAVVLLAGSVVAVIRARGVRARQDDHDRDVADPRSVRGPSDGHERVRPEESSPSSPPGVGDEDARPVGIPVRSLVHDELLRAIEERVAQRTP